jgi:hypothetical protein
MSTRRIMPTDQSTRLLATAAAPRSSIRRGSSTPLSSSSAHVPTSMSSAAPDAAPLSAQSDHAPTSTVTLDFATSIRNLQISNGPSSRNVLSSSSYHGTSSSSISPPTRTSMVSSSNHDSNISLRSIPFQRDGSSQQLLHGSSQQLHGSSHSLRPSLHEPSFNSSFHNNSSQNFSGSYRMRHDVDDDDDDDDSDSSFHDDIEVVRRASLAQMPIQEGQPTTVPPPPPPPPTNVSPRIHRSPNQSHQSLQEAREARHLRRSMRRNSSLVQPPQPGPTLPPMDDEPDYTTEPDPIDFLTAPQQRPPRSTRPDLQRAYNSMNTDFNTSGIMNASFAHRGHQSFAPSSSHPVREEDEDEALQMATLRSLFNNSGK